MTDWPRSWMGSEKDILPGEHLVVCFQLFCDRLLMLFCDRLLMANPTRKTVHKHMALWQYLWVERPVQDSAPWKNPRAGVSQLA
jgi:hypothetical protein